MTAAELPLPPASPASEGIVLLICMTIPEFI